MVQDGLLNYSLNLHYKATIQKAKRKKNLVSITRPPEKLKKNIWFATAQYIQYIKANDEYKEDIED